MTTSTPARDVTPPLSERWRTWRWVLLALLVIALVAVIGTYLTAQRPGGRMDAESTGPDGAHALVALLRDRGVDVVVAYSVDDVEQAARPNALLLVAESHFLVDDDVVRRLADVPGDRLLVEPVTTIRASLAPGIRLDSGNTMGGEPGCDLPEAARAGRVEFGLSDTYQAGAGSPVTRCYHGALMRYPSGARTITAVGSADFMTNSGLLKEGNAALAMNLTGRQSRLIWYAPQHLEGERTSGTGILALMPDNVGWMAWQLALVVVLVAWWRGRRMGPLVPENLPVVVRASETVEGRGRLYRSRRARDRAADALRTAALQRMLPRLGLAPNADPSAVVAAVAERGRGRPEAVHHTLYGPPPATDTDLVNLARELDDIGRQVADS